MSHNVRGSHSSCFCVSGGTQTPKGHLGCVCVWGGDFIYTDKYAKISLGSGALMAPSEEKPEEEEQRSGHL